MTPDPQPRYYGPAATGGIWPRHEPTATAAQIRHSAEGPALDAVAVWHARRAVDDDGQPIPTGLLAPALADQVRHGRGILAYREKVAEHLRLAAAGRRLGLVPDPETGEIHAPRPPLIVPNEEPRA